MDQLSASNEVIAALGAAAAQVTLMSGRQELPFRDFQVSFLKPPDAPVTAATARIVYQDDRTIRVEAQLGAQSGEVIAFALARFEAHPPYTDTQRSGFLSRLWQTLDAMSA